jgi:dephospho-CoA kinase
MLKVGLTGGLASGKSFVAKHLAEWGCHVIEADRLGHEVLQPGGGAHDAVLARFGTVDRKQLAAMVFQDPAQLAELNAIVHPAVFAREDELLNALPGGIAVIAAAILIEVGTYKNFDCLIVAFCTREQQIERAMAREGAVLEDVLARLDRQMPLEEKRKYADFVIDTSGSKEETIRQTRAVHHCLRLRPESK